MNCNGDEMEIDAKELKSILRVLLNSQGEYQWQTLESKKVDIVRIQALYDEVIEHIMEVNNEPNR